VKSNVFVCTLLMILSILFIASVCGFHLVIFSSSLHLVTSSLETSLLASRQLSSLKPEIRRRDVQTDTLALRIGAIKKIAKNPENTIKIYRPLEATLAYIRDMESLISTLNELQAEAYDSTKLAHEDLLLELWNALCPDTKLTSRVSNQWQQIGFQGSDPSTDFRSMGILALRNLVYFATRHSVHAARVLEDTNRPGNRFKWFSFAVAGINITAELSRLVKDRKLNDFFYRKGCTLSNFNELYSACFYRFNSAWSASNLPDIMSFQGFKKAFFENIAREGKVGFLITQVAL